MKTKSFLSFLLSLAGIVSAQTSAPEGLFYMYNGQRVPLTAKSSEVLVREQGITPQSLVSAESTPESRDKAAAAAAVKLAVPANAVSFSSLPGWARVDTTAAGKTMSMMANNTAIAFTTPVLQTPDGKEFAPTQDILIRYKAERDPAKVFLGFKNAALLSQSQIGKSGIWRARTNLRDGLQVLALANQLHSADGVEFASPDAIRSLDQHRVPSDPEYSKSWGLKNTGMSFSQGLFGRPQGSTVWGQSGFDMQAEQAWDITDGSGVIVLMMDDGVDPNHPDLNLYGMRDFTGSGDGRHVTAYDGHGTMVAGCIVAKAGNGRGTCGIAPGARVASAKISVIVLGSNGRPRFGNSVDSTVVEALDWGASIGARVSNSSWGGGNSDPVSSAFAQYAQLGMLHFVAAGNDGSGSVSWPANLPSVVAVGAAAADGTRAPFSQYGTGLAFMAPGEAIYTANRTDGSPFGIGENIFVPGTSFASPYAAGVAALVIASNPSLTPAQVLQKMVASCKDMGSPGYDSETGYGLLNAYRAVSGSGTTPPTTGTDDHGGTLATATTVSIPSTTAGNLEANSDSDFFKFTVSSPATLTLRSTGSTDTFAVLYDNQGNVLDQADDIIQGVERNFSISGQFGVGTYYLAVHSFEFSTSGAYQFVIESTTTTPPVIQPTYTLAPASSSVTADAATGAFGVQTQTTSIWFAQSTASWLMVNTPAASFTGSGTVSYSVQANTSSTARTGTITVGTTTFTLTQSGKTTTPPVTQPTYTLAPASASVTADAATGSLSVQTQATSTWFAQSTASWLMVNNPAASFTGSGTVSYSVQANTSTTARTGTITVGTTSFTLTQAGKTTTTPPTTTSLAGAYQGLIARSAALNGARDAADGFGGTIRIDSTTSGALTCKLQLGTAAVTGRGTLHAMDDGTATAELSIARRNLSPLTVSLTVDLVSGALNGSIADDMDSAEVEGHRLERNAALVGLYNNGLVSPEDDPALSPQGNGYLSFRVSSTGSVSLAGKLADGTAITGSSTLCTYGRIPLFRMIYSNTGSLSGWAMIDEEGLSTTGTVAWMKNPQTRATRSYADGFDNEVQLVGGRYTAPASGHTPMDMSPEAELDLLGGSLLEDLSQSFTLSARNAAVVPANANTIRLTLTSSTGLYSGSFKVADPENPAKMLTASFAGALVPGLSDGVGAGYFLLAQSSARDSAILSGKTVIR